MPKTHETKNYNIDEQLRLLSIIADRSPRQRAEWEQIAEEYNACSEAKAKSRSVDSLKRKFLSLSQSAKVGRRGGFSSVQHLASDIKRKLAYKEVIHLHETSHVKQHCNGQLLSEQRSHSGIHETNGWASEGHIESSAALGLGLPQTPPMPPLVRGDHNASALNKAAVHPAFDQTITLAQLPAPAASVNLKYTHCDSIQFYLWFQQYGKQQWSAWKAVDSREAMERGDHQRERKEDLRDAKERHRELLA